MDCYLSSKIYSYFHFAMIAVDGSAQFHEDEHETSLREFHVQPQNPALFLRIEHHQSGQYFAELLSPWG